MSGARYNLEHEPSSRSKAYDSRGRVYRSDAEPAATGQGTRTIRRSSSRRPVEHTLRPQPDVHDLRNAAQRRGLPSPQSSQERLAQAPRSSSRRDPHSSAHRPPSPPEKSYEQPGSSTRHRVEEERDREWRSQQREKEKERDRQAAKDRRAREKEREHEVDRDKDRERSGRSPRDRDFDREKRKEDDRRREAYDRDRVREAHRAREGRDPPRGSSSKMPSSSRRVHEMQGGEEHDSSDSARRYPTGSGHRRIRTEDTPYTSYTTKPTSSTPRPVYESMPSSAPPHITHTPQGMPVNLPPTRPHHERSASTPATIMQPLPTEPDRPARREPRHPSAEHNGTLRKRNVDAPPVELPPRPDLNERSSPPSDSKPKKESLSSRLFSRKKVEVSVGPPPVANVAPPSLRRMNSVAQSISRRAGPVADLFRPPSREREGAKPNVLTRDRGTRQATPALQPSVLLPKNESHPRRSVDPPTALPAQAHPMAPPQPYPMQPAPAPVKTSRSIKTMWSGTFRSDPAVDKYASRPALPIPRAPAPTPAVVAAPLPSPRSTKPQVIPSSNGIVKPKLSPAANPKPLGFAKSGHSPGAQSTRQLNSSGDSTSKPLASATPIVASSSLAPPPAHRFPSSIPSKPPLELKESAASTEPPIVFSYPLTPILRTPSNEQRLLANETRMATTQASNEHIWFENKDHPVHAPKIQPLVNSKGRLQPKLHRVPSMAPGRRGDQDGTSSGEERSKAAARQVEGIGGRGSTQPLPVVAPARSAPKAAAESIKVQPPTASPNTSAKPPPAPSKGSPAGQTSEVEASSSNSSAPKIQPSPVKDDRGRTRTPIGPSRELPAGTSARLNGSPVHQSSDHEASGRRSERRAAEAPSNRREEWNPSARKVEANPPRPLADEHPRQPLASAVGQNSELPPISRSTDKVGQPLAAQAYVSASFQAAAMDRAKTRAPVVDEITDNSPGRRTSRPMEEEHARSITDPARGPHAVRYERSSHPEPSTAARHDGASRGQQRPQGRTTPVSALPVSLPADDPDSRAQYSSYNPPPPHPSSHKTSATPNVQPISILPTPSPTPTKQVESQTQPSRPAPSSRPHESHTHQSRPSGTTTTYPNPSSAPHTTMPEPASTTNPNVSYSKSRDTRMPTQAPYNSTSSRPEGNRSANRPAHEEARPSSRLNRPPDDSSRRGQEGSTRQTGSRSRGTEKPSAAPTSAAVFPSRPPAPPVRSQTYDEGPPPSQPQAHTSSHSRTQSDPRHGSTRAAAPPRDIPLHRTTSNESEQLLGTPASIAPSMLKPTVSRGSGNGNSQDSRKKGLFDLFRSRTNSQPSPPGDSDVYNFVPPTTRRDKPSQAGKASGKTLNGLKPSDPVEVSIPSRNHSFSSNGASYAPSRSNSQTPRSSAPSRTMAPLVAANGRPFPSMRFLTPRRHRTVSAASFDATDGTRTQTNTIVGSPTLSATSQGPMPPAWRDPIVAASNWRKYDVGHGRDSSKLAKPGVVFDVDFEDDDPGRPPVRRPVPLRRSTSRGMRVERVESFD